MIMRAIFELVFGCKHTNYTWPITTKKKDGTKETTVSCLDCGKTMKYDFAKLGSEEVIAPPRRTAPKVHEIDTPEKALAFTAK